MGKFTSIMKGVATVVNYAGAVMVLIEGIEYTYERFKEKFGDPDKIEDNAKLS